MSEERKYGREGATPQQPAEVPVSGGLSEADKERIRQEEEYRAQVRAEAEAKAKPLTPAQKEEARRQQQKRIEELQRKEAERRAALSPEELKKEDTRNLWMMVALTIVLIGGVFSCNMKREFAPRAKSGPKPIASFDKYDVIGNCENSVKNKLKAPASAKFSSGSGPVFSGSEWNYTGYVDAQNSFGAMIRSSFTCTIRGTNFDDARISTTLLE